MKFSNLKKIFLLLFLFEVGLQLESKILFSKKKTYASKRILVLGDCVSRFYPLALQTYLASLHLDVELHDDIVYHDLSLNLAYEREDLIKKLNPDLIISMNGLFEANDRIAQHPQIKEQRKKTFNFKTISLLKNIWIDYFTSNGQVRKIAQKYLTTRSVQSFKDLENYLLKHSDSISDAYSRAFYMWLYDPPSTAFPQMREMKKPMKKTISLIQKKIIEQINAPSSFSFFELKKLSDKLTQSYWAFFSLARVRNASREKNKYPLFSLQEILIKNDPYGFAFFESIHAMYVFDPIDSLSLDSKIQFLEHTLDELANKKTTFSFIRAVDRGCIDKNILKCRLDFFDLFENVTLYFEFLKSAPLNPWQQKKFQTLRALYEPVLQGYSFEKKIFSFDSKPIGYQQTEKYYDELVGFVSSNNYKLIIAQYPTFSLDFLNKYNNPQKNIFVFDTPSLIKSTQAPEKYLSSLNSSIYNSNKASIEGNRLIGNALADFILKNNLL